MSFFVGNKKLSADEGDSRKHSTPVTVIVTAQHGLTHHVGRYVIHRTVSAMSEGATIDGFKIFPHFLLVSPSFQLKPRHQVVSRQFYGAQSQILVLVSVVR